MDEVQKILDAAKALNADLRLLGSTAFRIHCPNCLYYLDSMRRELTDIDLVALREERKKVKELFKTLGYIIDQKVLLETEGQRYCFYDTNKKINVDVFFDKLDYCHTIDLRERLKLDYPTLTVSDLLLEKMQIVKINEKDIKDTIVLLLEHPIGNEDKEAVNRRYICNLLSKDWGFYYTFTSNLKKVKQMLGTPGYAANMNIDELSALQAKIDGLLQDIEHEPKSIGWRLRAKIGTSKQWYREVELEKRTAF